MDDDAVPDEPTVGAEPPRLRYRPWCARGVPQPGADRPVGAGGVAPPAPVPPSYPPVPLPPVERTPPPRVGYVVVSSGSGVSGLGLASFILGILSFGIPWYGLLSVLAVVFGVLGRGGRSGSVSANGFAVAGAVLGLTSLILYLILYRGMFLRM